MGLYGDVIDPGIVGKQERAGWSLSVFFPVTLEDVTYRPGVGSLSAQSLFDGIFEFFLSKGAQKLLELAGCLSKGQATFCDLLEQFF